MRGARALIVVIALSAALPACSSSATEMPPCGEGNRWLLALAAQSVPSATYLPCVGSLPAGWSVTGSRFERGSYTAWLDSDRAGVHAVEMRLDRSCDVSAAVEVAVVDAPSGVRTFEEPIALSPAFRANRYVTFEGGCVTYTFRFAPGTPAALAIEAQQALGLVSRASVRRFVGRYGLKLCGAGAPPCPG